MNVVAIRSRALCVLALFAAQPAAAQLTETAEEAALLEAEARYAQPPAPIGEFLRRDPGYAVLNAPSPDGRYFLVPQATQLSTLELMSKPTYRLAELEVRPATDRLWHLDTFGINGLRIYDLQARRYREVSLPANTFISDPVWSPDGGRVAFLAHLPTGTEVWTADPANGRASRLSRARVLATLGTESHVNISPEVDMRPSRMLQWTPDGSVLTLVVPRDRGAEPARDPVPDGPVVRITRPEPTVTRTFPNLLRDNHDAALFEHYTRAQLVEITRGGDVRPLGEARMYESIQLSPDGEYILATFVERPFSFITSYRGFPRRTVVLDRRGAVVATLAEQDLREAGFGGNGGLRDLAWRPDDALLTWIARDDGEDRIMMVDAPFDTADANVIATSDDNMRDVVFSVDGAHVFATVSRNGRQAVAHWDLRADSAERSLLTGWVHNDSIFELPGELWTVATPNGIEHALMSSGGDAVYLRGDGLAADFRPQPFVDRVTLGDTTPARVFEGAKNTFDQPLVALDPDLTRMVVMRESQTLYPDSYLWERGGSFTKLTANENPFPELANARRIDFSFQRQDGLEVQGRVSLPVGYREGERVPAIFWTYPREYEEPEEYTRAAIRSRNHNAFPHMTWLRWSDLWLTQGYALVYPDIPIIGENYNDTYIANMVSAMYGAMRAVDGLDVIDMDRIGHGGHSYGAFATANLLAHTPYFKAGIAGDGAYNRSLTPTGFQAERRDIWSAPDTYIEMSPFFKVDQIEAPLLMYHGGDDNNTGTWPMQSERFLHALTSKGKTAALYVYPYESHTPRALENKLDLWARWIGWFDRYVKGAAGDVTAQ
ncbi:MAG TPA: prolyl oligopeptidase family serine peptidase [Longimicrobiales bacterium]|nr:prolyl oligopeptidase family serine peptidase [Longimicrobiales bacterium]